MAKKSKTGKVLLTLGIVFMLAAIGFFVARNEQIQMQHRAEMAGLRGYYYYAKAFGYTAYGFLSTAIPFIVVGVKKLIK